MLASLKAGMEGLIVLISVKPFLMFQHGKGREALTFYMELFPEARIDHVTYYSEEDELGVTGTIQLAQFTIHDQSFMCIDSHIEHSFDFTPSFSIYITCESEDEINHLYETLIDGGQALMPIGNYGFSKRFGWVNDRFGVSWQLSWT